MDLNKNKNKKVGLTYSLQRHWLFNRANQEIIRLDVVNADAASMMVFLVKWEKKEHKFGHWMCTLNDTISQTDYNSRTDEPICNNIKKEK